jgi:hypothetical protein
MGTAMAYSCDPPGFVTIAGNPAGQTGRFPVTQHRPRAGGQPTAFGPFRQAVSPWAAWHSGRDSLRNAMPPARTVRTWWTRVHLMPAQPADPYLRKLR